MLKGSTSKGCDASIGLRQMFFGFYCSSFVLVKDLVVLVPQKTMVDKFLQVSKLIVS